MTVQTTIDLKEKKELANEIKNAFDTFKDLVAAFTNENFNKVPFPGSWTPAQVASHIIMATDGIPDEHTQIATRGYKEQIGPVTAMWTNYSVKMKSPDFLVPNNPLTNKLQALKEINRIKEKLVSLALEKDLTEICPDFPIPPFGELSRYEWLVFIALHVQRHAHQLREMHKVFR
jgi:hypothetical protein